MNNEFRLSPITEAAGRGDAAMPYSLEEYYELYEWLIHAVVEPYKWFLLAGSPEHAKAVALRSNLIAKMAA